MHHVIVQSGRRIEIDARVLSRRSRTDLAVLEQRRPGLFDMIMAHDLSERGRRHPPRHHARGRAAGRSWPRAWPPRSSPARCRSKLEDDLERLQAGSSRPAPEVLARAGGEPGRPARRPARGRRLARRRRPARRGAQRRLGDGAAGDRRPAVLPERRGARAAPRLEPAGGARRGPSAWSPSWAGCPACATGRGPSTATCSSGRAAPGPTRGLEIPHPRLAERRFALLPAARARPRPGPARRPAAGRPGRGPRPGRAAREAATRGAAHEPWATIPGRSAPPWRSRCPTPTSSRSTTPSSSCG